MKTTTIRAVTVLAFLLLILAGMLVLLCRLLPAPAAKPGDWLSGGVTARLDRQLARSVPRSTALDGWLNGLLFAATGDAGPQVRQGCPGWLFLAEETASTPHGVANFRQRLRLAGLLQADLKRRGIALLTLPVPDKVEQARAQLCGLAVSAQARGRRSAWQAASPALGLHQVDLSRGWPSPAYWRTDSHWDRTGATLAANRVAAAMPPLAQGAAGAGAAVFRAVTAPSAQPRTGDLYRLAELGPPFGPAPEYDHAVTLDIERGGALLDDVAAPQVLLAGSSYSLNSGFIDALQLALQQDVSQQSRAGSGYAGSLLDLLRHPQRLDGVKVVVWEWPLRVLYQPLTDAELAYLNH